MLAEGFSKRGETVLAAALGANDQGQSVQVKKRPQRAPRLREHLGIVGVLQFKCGTIIPNLPL